MSFAKPTSPPAVPRKGPPLWTLGVAILLGAAAALISPFGHAHGDGGFFHSHGFAGPHSHGPEPAGAPLPADGGEKDTRILALAFAASLCAATPAPARAEADASLARPLPPSRPPAAVYASPWSPRGPPAFPC
jgi:hypothetical protein